MKKNLVISGIISGIIIIILLSISTISAANEQRPNWAKETQGFVLSIELVGDEMVTGSRGGIINYFDANGRVKWKYLAQGDVGSISSSGDTISVGTAEGYIYSFDKNSNNPRWSALVGGVPSVAVSDKYIASGTYNGQLFVFDKYTGEKVWELDESKSIYSVFSIAVSGDILFITTADVENELSKNGYIYAFDINTGKQKWRNKIRGWIYTSAVSDDMIVVGTWEEDKGGVYAFSISGNSMWKYAAPEDVTSVAIAENSVAFGTGNSYDEDKIYLVDKNTGELKWEQYVRNSPYPDTKALYSNPWLALSDGSVIVGLRDNNVHVYEKETGCERWNYKTGGDVHTVAYGNGKVIAGSWDKKVYVFDEGEIGSVQCNRMDAETKKMVTIIAAIVMVLCLVVFYVFFIRVKT